MTTVQQIEHIRGVDFQTGQPTPTIACRVLGEPRRTIGLGGDTLRVAVPAQDWPGGGPLGWDLASTIEVTFGDTSGTITLGGYRLRRVIDSQRGAPVVEGGGPTGSGTASAKVVTLELVTEPGFWRDGRGGVLTEGVLNRLGEDGAVDQDAADFTLNSDLAALCISAMGFVPPAVGTGLPTSLDDFGPPGPLEWDNAPALNEFEALLDRVGHAAVYSNDGETLSVVRLSRAGETVSLDASLVALAEPFDLYSAPAIRSRTVLVTSGRTRATVVTSRQLDSANPLEWVWFDERTGRWLDDAETATLYPSERQPGVIDDYRLGPGKTVDEQQQFARVFTAVRINEAEIEKVGRFAGVSEPVSFGGAMVAGSLVVVEARAAKLVADGTELTNEPEESADPPVRVAGARISPEHGVVDLPETMEFVRMAPANEGTRAEATALLGDELVLRFAHEARTGDFAVDYFVRGYEFDDTLQTVTELDATALDLAIADPDTLRVEAPFLRLIYTNDDGTSTFTPVNDTVLDPIAREIAESHVNAQLAATGIVELIGLHPIEPGASGGLVTGVRWDIDGRKTILDINQHEVPGSRLDELQLSARRSFATGLAGLDAAPTAVDAVAARGGTPRDGGGQGNGEGAEPGAEAARTPRVRVSPARSARTGGFRILAEITGSDATLGSNRWWYDWTQVFVKVDGSVAGAGMAGLTSVDEGQALNVAELNNSGAGVEPSMGIDVDGLPGTFEPKPLATGLVVELVGPIDGASQDVWLIVGSAANAVDGGCA